MKSKIILLGILFVTAFHVYGSALIFQDNNPDTLVSRYGAGKSSEVRYIKKIKWQPECD